MKQTSSLIIKKRLYIININSVLDVFFVLIEIISNWHKYCFLVGRFIKGSKKRLLSIAGLIYYIYTGPYKNIFPISSTCWESPPIADKSTKAPWHSEMPLQSGICCAVRVSQLNEDPVIEASRPPWLRLNYYLRMFFLYDTKYHILCIFFIDTQNIVS